MVASSHEDAARVGCGSQSRICWRVHLAGSGFFFGRPRQGDVAECDHTNTARSEIAGPEFVQSIHGSKTDAVLRPIGAVPGTAPEAWAAEAVSPRCATADLQLVGIHLPALAHVEHDPAQQLVALRVEAQRASANATQPDPAGSPRDRAGRAISDAAAEADRDRNVAGHRRDRGSRRHRLEDHADQPDGVRSRALGRPWFSGSG